MAKLLTSKVDTLLWAIWLCVVVALVWAIWEVA